METKKIFSDLLLLGTSWEVETIQHNKGCQEICITISYKDKDGFCTETDELSLIYDYRRMRKWQHLPLFQCKTYLQARIPRIKNSLGDIISVEVPWAEASKRYSFFLKNL